ncbi:phosphotransferase [Pseudonocardia cypriaca]|uniref:O-antigen/teichoic acid export membrane protein n=1 Tax=Pseudonocardia cypriaca TaxID=882449 RepID=A0A543GGU2_9PSEU|nr:phosphotransferase [Pseudonocardia cypriaca]TQM45298.1 O-antigen/teichoic acid export membrane protein [Pseudonocardia cypriaca]
MAVAVARVKGLLTGWRAPQHRDGLALVMSSGLSSAVGLLYWVLAAQMFPADVVGVNAVALSSLMLVGGVAHLNMSHALLRFVPVAGTNARRLVVLGYLVAIALSGLAGAGFGAGAIWWAPELVDVAGYGTLIAFFALSCPVWTLFTLQDYVLTAVGRAVAVPIENLVFAVLKIGLLVSVALAAVPGGIAVSWVVATALIVLPINLWLLVRLLPAHGTKTADRAVPITAGAVSRFIGADYVGALFWQAAMMGLPVLVLNRLGAEAAAAYNMVWQFGVALYMVPSGMGQSMIAHSAADPASVDKARRETVRRGLMLVVPVALVLAIGAPLVLALFGPHYAATGTAALALVALSAIPNVITAAATSTARVRQRRGVQFGVPTSLSVLTIGLAWILMPHLGVLAVGLAWLLAQCAVAAVVLLMNAPWIPGPVGRWIDGIRSSALLRRIGDDVLTRIGAPSGWALGSRMGGGSETVVVAVGPAGEHRAILKAADTEYGQQDLRQQTAALSALHADPRLAHWTPLIPRVLGTAEIGGAYCVTESLLPGGSGPDALDDPARRGAFLSSGVSAISELHRRTATLRRVGDTELDEWVHRPVVAISATLPAALRAEARQLAALLDARLRDQVVGVGWTHGDYLPVNLLAAPNGRVSAIVDWCTARPDGMSVVDVATFVPMAEAMTRGEEFGTVVLRWLAGVPRAEAEVLVGCQSALGGSILAPEVLVLLGWLGHVESCVTRSQQMAANPVWNRRNVRVVVQGAAGLLGAQAPRPEAVTRAAR